MSEIAHAMPFMLQNEGGYVNNPADHGGATNLGITIGTLAAWRHHPVTADDVRHLTIADVTPIYKHNYWDMLNLDAIHDQGCATAIFDMCVNFGPGGAKSLVQRALNALGHADVNSCEPKLFIQSFERAVENRYNAIVASNPSQKVFYRGWMNRAHRLLTLVA